MTGATLGERLFVLRAAVASTISSKLEAPLVSGPGEAGRSYLALVGRGLELFGRQLLSELLPLELLMRSAKGEGRNEVGDRPMTHADLELDSLMAQLHDEILNPAWPFTLEPPLQIDIRTINHVYGSALRNAEVAGQIALSGDTEAAYRLLFDAGEPTPLLVSYRSYEAQVDEVVASLTDADLLDDTRARLKRKLERLEAEWSGLGGRQKVEHAFDAIRAKQNVANFENRRAAVAQRLDSGERLRRDAPGLAYFRSHLVPTQPLFDKGSSAWQRLVLDKEQVVSSISLRARKALGLNSKQVLDALEGVVEVTCELLVCDIRRDWLDPTFLTERYWRLPGNTQLSDGAGGGEFPCLPLRIVFVRNLTYSTESIGVELISPQPRTGAVVLKEPGPRRIATETLVIDTKRRAQMLEVAQQTGLASSARMLATEQVSLKSQNLIPLNAETLKASTTSALQSALPPDSTLFVQAATVNQNLNLRQFTQMHIPGKIQFMLREAITGDAKKPVRSIGSERTKPNIHVTGSIRVDKGEQRLLLQLYVSVGPSDPPFGHPVGVELEHRSPLQADFAATLEPTQTINEHTEPIRKYVLRLHRTNGEVVAEHIVDMASPDHQLALEWHAAPKRTIHTIAAETPIVHAYVVRVNPQSPDPDDSLVWT